MSTPTLRLATLSDCEAIHDIYNYYVIHSTCTYQTEPDPIEVRRAWFTSRGPEHPVIVAEVDGRVVGWGSLSRFHQRAAYARTVETAVYIDHKQRGRGIGRAIATDLIDRAVALNHHTIIALVSAEQAGSLALHEKLGFKPAGRLSQAGYKFDQWLDVVYLQKML
jgi:phosphinothricin acetyltransferase